MNNNLIVESKDLPSLYIAADYASLTAQTQYFRCLKLYLLLLVTAAWVSYSYPIDITGSILSLVLFLTTLGILIFIRTYKPDDIWYNGRAVAESVKTRSWRWMMRAEPYIDSENVDIVAKEFIRDLKIILDENKNLSLALKDCSTDTSPISPLMRTIRSFSVDQRLSTYIDQRVKDQEAWYWKKSQFNKRQATVWFYISVILHGLAIILLAFKIFKPQSDLPIAVLATAAGASLTWLQAKKHNELHSAYTLTAHEIVLLKGSAINIQTEKQLSDFIVDSETAFSREHTQWIARKGS